MNVLIVRCPRCCLRYESRGLVAAVDAACPHCGDVHVGIGRSFDEACTDAVMRLRRQGQNDVWSVRSHCLYTDDVADQNAPDVNLPGVRTIGMFPVLVHMVHLCLESSL